MSETKVNYDEMNGAQLGEELARRELPVSGKVDELRARLREDDEKRAQEAVTGSDDPAEGEETSGAEVEVPEPREPLRMEFLTLTLTEDQARELTRREAGIARFMKHVAPFEATKYLEGDQVIGVTVDRKTAAVLGVVGLTIELEPEA